MTLGVLLALTATTLTQCKQAQQNEATEDSLLTETVLGETQIKNEFHDIELSEAEFKKAMSQVSQKDQESSARTPDAADTAALQSWGKANELELETFLPECSFLHYTPNIDALEIAIGDFCCTRLKEDTVDMVSCGMVLSPTSPRYFGGIKIEIGAGEPDCPAYIYLYPLLADGRHVGKPFVLETTKKWLPSGLDMFWGTDGCFYVGGYDHHANHAVYHKLQPVR